MFHDLELRVRFQQGICGIAVLKDTIWICNTDTGEWCPD